MLGLDLAVGLLLFLGALQRPHLVLGEDQSFLRHLGRERLQPLLEGRQVVAQPDRAHPRWRGHDRALPELVRHPHLTVRRLLECERHHRRLDPWVGAVLQVRLLA